MAGAHDERESVAARLGLTPLQRDQLIWTWSHQGWSQRLIAKQLGITQPAVKYAIDRLSGKQRKRSQYGLCDDCGATFPVDQLVDGLCSECEGGS